MTDSKTLDLGSLFGAALQAMEENQQQVNDLDGYNGNHGSNMVENLRIVTEAVSARQGAPPTEALHYASRELQARGHGGTSQYYVKGLDGAAERLQGRSALNEGDVLSLVQSLLGAVPSEGHPQQTGAGSSVLDQVMGLASGPAPQGGGGILSQVLGGLSGGQQTPPPAVQDDGLGLDDVLETLLPAGLAFLQAQQSGANTTSAAGQALMSILGGGQVNPLQAQRPRDAAGGLLAQGLLRALLNRR